MYDISRRSQFGFAIFSTTTSTRLTETVIGKEVENYRRDILNLVSAGGIKYSGFSWKYEQFILTGKKS